MGREIHIPEVKNTDTSELELDETNPNHMNETRYNALKKNIERFGFIVPVITNKAGLVADGEHRLRAARDLGIKEIPVIKLDLDSVSHKIIRQVMNKLSGVHDHDFDLADYEHILEQDRGEELKELVAFDDKYWQSVLDELRESQENEVPPPEEASEVETSIKRGEVYRLGRHRLMCGDATKEKHVETLMDGGRADMVFTDPPYNIDYDYNEYEDDKGDIEYTKWCSEWFKTLREISELIFITVGWKYERYWLNQEPYNKIIWYEYTKQSGGRAYHLRKTEPVYIFGEVREKFDWNILEIRHDREKLGGVSLEKLHSCPKPVELPAQIIKKQTTDKDIILDVFGGSGSTLIAAEQTNRTCYMMELDPQYCEVICQRWEQHTGKKRKKIEGGG